jgi:hypothetical protein
MSGHLYQMRCPRLFRLPPQSSSASRFTAGAVGFLVLKTAPPPSLPSRMPPAVTRLAILQGFSTAAVSTAPVAWRY